MNMQLAEEAIKRYNYTEITHDIRFKLAGFILQAFIPSEEIQEYIRFITDDIKDRIIQVSYNVKTWDEIFEAQATADSLTKIERFIHSFRYIMQVLDQDEIQELAYYLRNETDKILS